MPIAYSICSSGILVSMPRRFQEEISQDEQKRKEEAQMAVKRTRDLINLLFDNIIMRL